MKIVFLTDSSSGEIKASKRTNKFKKTTSKRLMAKGKISRLAIQLLKEIENRKVTEEESKIIELLKKEDEKD